MEKKCRIVLVHDHSNFEKEEVKELKGKVADLNKNL